MLGVGNNTSFKEDKENVGILFWKRVFFPVLKLCPAGFRTLYALGVSRFHTAKGQTYRSTTTRVFLLRIEVCEF